MTDHATYGWPVPGLADPADITQVTTLADAIAADLDPAAVGDGRVPFWWASGAASYTFTGGTLDVTYGSLVPDGFVFAAPPTVLPMMRSTSYPASSMVLFAVGTTTTTGCVIHAQRAGTAVSGALAMYLSLIGVVRRV